jgi:carboxyl-terminal processing protease
MNKRSLLYAPAVIGICSVIGGLLGPGAGDVSAATQEEDVKASLRTFSRVYDLVEQNFADKVDPDKSVYRGAIPSMMRALDPHSNFFDPREFQLLREDQKGQYYGVGMKVGSRNNRTVVIAPFVDSPAAKAGLRPGDMLITVNGKDTIGLRTDEVADLLKGPKGTTAQVAVERDGAKDLLPFSITRDSIPRKSVPDAFWIKPGILYVFIEHFNETTSKELEAHFRRVGEDNVKGLILDLRENPGGLLNEGVAVADRFLQKGQTIVSHRGRASAERPYVARSGNGGRSYPIVTVVNRNSASASEIVSGALQDHDRALVFGEVTFGKGLVQTVYPLSENTGLALTTAKYYTPSGRLIQRDYSSTSFFDYYYRKTDTKNLQDVKMTDSGRTVYGGGGITPDEKYDVPKANALQITLQRNYAFLNFAAHYMAVHGRTLAKDWQVDVNVMSEFRAFLAKQEIPFEEPAFAENTDWIKWKIREEMFINAFDVDEGRKASIEGDPMILKAIDSLPKAKDLLDNAHKMVVERARANQAVQ